MADNVNHPKHYNMHPAGVECITIVEHMNFNVGNAIKYLWRAGLKMAGEPERLMQGNEVTERLKEKHLEDLQKAQWYINRELQRLFTMQARENAHMANSASIIQDPSGR